MTRPPDTWDNQFFRSGGHCRTILTDSEEENGEAGCNESKRPHGHCPHMGMNPAQPCPFTQRMSPPEMQLSVDQLRQSVRAGRQQAFCPGALTFSRDEPEPGSLLSPSTLLVNRSPFQSHC